MRRPGPLRWSLVAPLGLAALAGTVGAALAAFSGATTNAGNDLAASATFPPVFVRHVGSATCGATSNAVAVPAGGVPSGRTLLVHVVLRGGTYDDPVGATDSRGNTYAIDEDVTNAGSSLRTIVLSAYVSTALQAGDSIVVTHGNAQSSGAAVEEVRRIPSVSPVDASGVGTGSDNAPAASGTSTAQDTLVYGVEGHAGTQTVTAEGAGFTVAHDVVQNCGAPPHRKATNHAAYRIVATSGAFTYDPTLSGTVGWAAAAVAYTG